MELHPDTVVHSLKVLVDPADGSYTPSLLVVSAGDSLIGMKEIAAVAVGLQVYPSIHPSIHLSIYPSSQSLNQPVIHSISVMLQPFLGDITLFFWETCRRRANPPARCQLAHESADQRCRFFIPPHLKWLNQRKMRRKLTKTKTETKK